MAVWMGTRPPGSFERWVRAWRLDFFIFCFRTCWIIFEPGLAWPGVGLGIVPPFLLYRFPR